MRRRGEGQLADLALELLDHLVLKGLVVLGVTAQAVFGTGQETLPPVLDLGYGQAVFASCLGHCRFALDDADHQRYAPLGSPTLNLIRDVPGGLRSSFEQEKVSGTAPEPDPFLLWSGAALRPITLQGENSLTTPFSSSYKVILS
jgi:hypothetical protein